MIIPGSEPEQQLLTTTAPATVTPHWKMPNWYFDKKELKNTPSIRDGLDFETDRRYRREGARFIMECGTKMGLGHNTMATGVVYFHRFYVFHSFKSFPRYVTACCCLFLAGKVEETPKKCRDIIKWARSMLSDQKFASFGDDAKEEVMTLERILLQTIKFDLQVEHPYSYLVKYAKCLKGDQKQLGKMVQMAWNFVNDSLSTTVCLQWEPEIIAVALIHLASKLSKFSVTKWDGQLPTHLRWWDMFVADVTMEILEDICHQVLDLYQEPNQMDADSPPQLPPSKSSPPMKRGDKVSPVYPKTSPAAAGVAGGVGLAVVGQPVQVIGGGGGGHSMQSGASIPPLPHGQPLQQHPLPPQQQQQQQQHQHHHHPMAAQHAHHSHAHKASIEEKLLNMPSAAMHQRNNNSGGGLMDSMGYGGGGHHVGYGGQPAAAYGTMFQHSQFGGGGQASVGQPPLPPPPSQQQQQQTVGMYSGGGGNSNQYVGGGGGQQQIPAHYQSGGGGGSQGYYQQPPQSGRGGYYQGPP